MFIVVMLSHSVLMVFQIRASIVVFVFMRVWFAQSLCYSVAFVLIGVEVVSLSCFVSEVFV